MYFFIFFSPKKKDNEQDLRALAPRVSKQDFLRAARALQERKYSSHKAVFQKILNQQTKTQEQVYGFFVDFPQEQQHVVQRRFVARRSLVHMPEDDPSLKILQRQDLVTRLTERLQDLRLSRGSDQLDPST